MKLFIQILVILLSLTLLILLKEVWIAGFAGILFCVILSFPVQLLCRWLPRGVAVMISLLLFIGLAGGGTILGFHPLSEQVSQVVKATPAAMAKVKSWFQENEDTGVGKEIEKSKGSIEEKAGQWLDQGLEKTGKLTIGLVSALSLLVVIFVLGAFFVHEPNLYYQGLSSLVPKEHEKDLQELWKRLRVGLRHWLGGILVSMLIMGLVCAIGLKVIGIQNWLLLGIITFFATFVPYVGAIASAVPGLLLGLAASPEKCLEAAGVYLLVHIVEGYVVQPLIMKRAVEIRPAVLLLWQLSIGAIFGVLGILIATPLLVCVQITVGYLYIEKTLHKKSESGKTS